MHIELKVNNDRMAEVFESRRHMLDGHISLHIDLL